MNWYVKLQDDASLTVTARSQPDALIDDPVKAAEQALKMVLDKKVRTVSGGPSFPGGRVAFVITVLVLVIVKFGPDWMGGGSDPMPGES